MSIYMILLYVVISALCGLACYFFAKAKGKENLVAWFFIGFFGSVAGIGAVLLTKKVVSKAKS